MSKRPEKPKADKVSTPVAPTRARKKAAKKSAPKKSAPKKTDAAEKPKRVKKDPFEVARQTVKRSVPKIMKKMVEEAEGGSCTHAKMVLEMTGAKRMFEGEANGDEQSEPWAKLVLEKLDEAEE